MSIQLEYSPNLYIHYPRDAQNKIKSFRNSFCLIKPTEKWLKLLLSRRFNLESFPKFENKESVIYYPPLSDFSGSGSRLIILIRIRIPCEPKHAILHPVSYNRAAKKDCNRKKLFFCRNCVAMAKDSRSTFPIIDDNGCPVDPTIFPRYIQLKRHSRVIFA